VKPRYIAAVAPPPSSSPRRSDSLRITAVLLLLLLAGDFFFFFFFFLLRLHALCDALLAAEPRVVVRYLCVGRVEAVCVDLAVAVVA
jgi:hypothetical protein